MKAVSARSWKMPEFRQTVHTLVAAGLYYSGLLNLCSWFRRRVLKRREIAVIGLHRVLTQEEASHSLAEPGMILLLPTFERMLRILRKHYRVVGLSDLESFANGDLSRPLCMITFDDGWRDNFRNARPLLQKLDLPATLFAATGCIGSGEMFWVERLARVWKYSREQENLVQELRKALPGAVIDGLPDAIAALKEVSARDRENIIRSVESGCSNLPEADPVDSFMNWEQLKACADVFEIGSHTVMHSLLTHEEGTTVRRELAASKSELELRLQSDVSAFAYPSGDFDAKTLGAVGKAGYAFAFTTETRRFRSGDNRLAIPRILLHEGNLAGLTGRCSAARLHLRLMGWRLVGWR